MVAPAQFTRNKW